MCVYGVKTRHWRLLPFDFGVPQWMFGFCVCFYRIQLQCIWLLACSRYLVYLFLFTRLIRLLVSIHTRCTIIMGNSHDTPSIALKLAPNAIKVLVFVFVSFFKTQWYLKILHTFQCAPLHPLAIRVFFYLCAFNKKKNFFDNKVINDEINVHFKNLGHCLQAMSLWMEWLTISQAA